MESNLQKSDKELKFFNNKELLKLKAKEKKLLKELLETRDLIKKIESK